MDWLHGDGDAVTLRVARRGLIPVPLPEINGVEAHWKSGTDDQKSTPLRILATDTRACHARQGRNGSASLYLGQRHVGQRHRVVCGRSGVPMAIQRQCEAEIGGGLPSTICLDNADRSWRSDKSPFSSRVSMTPNGGLTP